jgi:flavin-dependent dehydrogenase
VRVETPDVLVVGAGPAGSAFVLYLARAAPAVASRTLVLEKHRHPRHKVCAGGLIPHTLRRLRELGIELSVPHATVHRATARIPSGTVEYADRDLCAVVRRREFDALLLTCARHAGVTVDENEKVVAVRRENGRFLVATDRREIRPKVLIGADGSGSLVRRDLFGVGRETIGRAVMCDLMWRQIGAIDAERYVFDFRAVPHGLKGYVWEFPCWLDGEPALNLGAYALDRGEAVSLTALVREHARGLGVVSPRLEAFPIRWYDARGPIALPGALLAGDAAGCDPLMGEGISYAFEYARLAADHVAEAFERGQFDFAEYTRAVAHSWFGRKLRRLGTVARVFYGRGARLGFALASRSRRLQDVGIRWYNGVGDWDRISGWQALGRALAGRA